jgi:hypothetical protein
MTPVQRAKAEAFLFGMGSVFDLRGRFVFGPHGHSVFSSIGSDFGRVGDDFGVAIEQMREETAAHAAQQMSLKLNG